MPSRILLALVILATPAFAGTQVPGSPHLAAIQDVRIFDGDRVMPKGTVVIAGDSISAIGVGIAVPQGATVIDGTGKTLLPGLVDAHVHIWSEDGLRNSLVFGVTSVVDMFMDVGTMRAIKAKQASGESAGMATLVSAGVLATAPGGHGTEYGLTIPTLATPDSAQAFVDARIQEGSDFIKIIVDDGRVYGLNWPTLDSSQVRAIAAAAHRRGKLAVAHISTVADARMTIEAGVDGLAHLYCEDAWDPELGNLAAKHGIFVIPTLSVLESISGTSGATELLSDPNLSPYISQADASGIKMNFGTPQAGGTKAYEGAEKGLRQMKAAGVTILAGTDAPNPGTAYGVSLHRELGLLVNAGLTPVEALRAATSLPADIFGLNGRGRIAPGARADLLLVEGDPTQSIAATRSIVAVWKDGAPVDRAARLVEVEAENAKIAQQKETPAPPGSESGLISDFEDEGVTAKFGAGWTVSTDKYMGGSSTGEIARTEGGAGGSRGAMLITGTIQKGSPYPWAGAFFAPGQNFMMPANLSARHALAFWARGEGKTYSVMVFAQSLGFMPAVKTFVADPGWAEHIFTFEDFGIEGQDVTGIFFGGADLGDFRLEIDDVRLE